MNRIVYTFLVSVMTVCLFAQSNISQPIDIQIKKKVIPPRLRVVSKPSFEDPNGNRVINANENCKIRFQIKNAGKGDARNCIASLITKGKIDGLTIKDVPLPIIPAGQGQWVEIPIQADESIQNSTIQYSLVVNEPNGYNTDPITGTIYTNLISDVDENIPQTNTKNENTFVLIIANEHYKRVDPVRFAENDGNIFYEYCKTTLGINEKHILHIPNATLNEIKQGVNRLKKITEMRNKSQQESQVILYYAGHGIPNESNRSAYLLPIDGSGTDVTTGYKLDELYATLGTIPASQITVFMDACFSGSKREQGMLVSARGVALKAKSGIPKGNMVVFSAAQGDETAYPNYEQQHGLFTYYLLKKLQETKGNVTLKALGDYVIQNVEEKSFILNNKEQTPCVTPSASLGTEWYDWKLK